MYFDFLGKNLYYFIQFLDEFRGLQYYGHSNAPINEIVISKDLHCDPPHMALYLTAFSNLDPEYSSTYSLSTNRWKGALFCASYAYGRDIVSRDGTCPSDLFSCNGFCFRDKCPLTSISLININKDQFTDSSSQFTYEDQYYELVTESATEEILHEKPFINRLVVNSQIPTDPIVMQRGMGICESKLNGVRTEPVGELININRICSESEYNPQYTPIDTISRSSLSPTSPFTPEEAFLYSSFPNNPNMYTDFKEFTHPDAMPTLYVGYEYPINIDSCIASQVSFDDVAAMFPTHSRPEHLGYAIIFICILVDCIAIGLFLITFIIGVIIRATKRSTNEKSSEGDIKIYVALQQQSRQKCSALHFFRSLHLSIVPHAFGIAALILSVYYISPIFHAVSKISNSGCFIGDFVEAISSVGVYAKYRGYMALTITSLILRVSGFAVYFAM